MAQIFCQRFDKMEVVITPYYFNHVAVIYLNGKITARYIFGEGQLSEPYFEVNIATSYFEIGKRRYNFCDGQKLEFIPEWYNWLLKSDKEQNEIIKVTKREKSILENISKKQNEFWKRIGFVS